MLPTLQESSTFSVKRLMLVMAEASRHGLSLVHVINGLRNTRAWPVDVLEALTHTAFRPFVVDES